MSEDFDNIRQVLANIPGAKAEGTITRLGGLTNRVYRTGDLCIRLPGAGTRNTSTAATNPWRRAMRRAPV